MDVCPGSFDRPERLPPVRSDEELPFLPHGRCPACSHAVQIHPLEPGGEDVWRLEMHDTEGRVIPMGNLKGRACPECGSGYFSVDPGPQGDRLRLQAMRPRLAR
jgi:hypothetical protein